MAVKVRSRREKIGSGLGLVMGLIAFNLIAPLLLESTSRMLGFAGSAPTYRLCRLRLSRAKPNVYRDTNIYQAIQCLSGGYFYHSISEAISIANHQSLFIHPITDVGLRKLSANLRTNLLFTKTRYRPRITASNMLN